MKEKIKVLQLINSMDPGGAENLLASQLSYFNYNKFDIYIGNLYGNNTLIKKNQKKYKIIDFSNKGKFSYFLIFKLIYFLIKYKIDIVHTHLVQASVIARLVSFCIPKIKCITTRHYAIESKPDRMINKIENSTLKYSTAIVCISNYVKRYITNNLNISENKLVTIYNGIDLSFFDKTLLKKDNNKITIGTIGRLSKQKGIDVLLKSFQKLIIKYPDLILEIIGDGELKKELIKLSFELGLEKKVKFLGKISPKKVKEHLNTWTIFVLASRWEAFGIVLIEAMAMEKAIVATNAEAIPEIIENRKNGYICSIDNHKEIADKIELLMENKKKRIKFGKNGREKVKKFFDIELKVKEIEDLYIKIIK